MKTRLLSVCALALMSLGLNVVSSRAQVSCKDQGCYWGETSFYRDYCLPSCNGNADCMCGCTLNLYLNSCGPCGCQAYCIDLPCAQA
jgi:hypothetical protein